MFLTATIDATLAAQNTAIAAESLGLGIVYIGAVRNQPEAIAEVLQLPPHLFAVFGMCVGYPDPAQPAYRRAACSIVKPRLPQSAVLHRETYSSGSQKQAVEQYNRIMKDFYQTQGINVSGDWVEHSLNRVAAPRSLMGRDRLRVALGNLGFKLL